MMLDRCLHVENATLKGPLLTDKVIHYILDKMKLLQYLF
jgi:hypothetical protein